MDDSKPSPPVQTRKDAPAPRNPPAQTPRAGGEGGVKDTIESILVAFILAFVFRAFVVEAFVIPTGSMAPTLLGAHMRFRCPDCGYEFTVNYSSPISRGGPDDDVYIPRYAELPNGRPQTVIAYCPNCGFRIGDEERADPKFEIGANPKVVTGPAVHYGDRILVLKYQYIFQDPQRWDVVVFKSPDRPETYHYSQNYIKRLVGKPGESILILDGDVYISHDADGSKIESYEIAQKPNYVQESLWRIVYDNDYYPQGITRFGFQNQDPHKWTQPWESKDAAWSLGSSPTSGRIFLFNNPTGSGTLNFNRDANPEKHALTDWLAYDVAGPQDRGTRSFDNIRRGGGENNVSDLKLDLFYRRTSGAGPLRLILTKRDRTFIAEITDTSARLLMSVGNGAESSIGQPVSLTSTNAPRHLEFINADYRVSLRIDGVEVLATTSQDYRADPRKLLDAFQLNQSAPPPAVQIKAEKQSCELSHVKLYRDVYYINRQGGLVWAVPEGRMLHLSNEPGKREFFVLGDNSLISGDARYWTSPINLPEEDLVLDAGRVPERFMLGRAFFVYWPAGYRPFRESPGLIPDFGDMRFIH